MACPAGSPYVHAHSIGTLQDSRGCGSCGCASPTANCDGTWTFYPSTDCNGGGTEVVVVDGNCDATPPQSGGGGGGNPTYQSYQFSASPTEVQCAVSQQPQPTGSAGLTGQDSICCE